MQKGRRDFFISYNKADKEWAKWIAAVLESEGYSTYIQAWDFRPGSNFILEMQKAITMCNKTIVVFSENYVNSEYCQSEWSSVFNADPSGNNRTLIPIRVTAAVPSGLLGPIINIDLFHDGMSLKSKDTLLKGVDEKPVPRKSRFM